MKRRIEVPFQGTKYIAWQYRGVAPAYGEMPFQGICSFHSHTHGDAAGYGEFAPSGRTVHDDAPTVGVIPHAPTVGVIPHAPTVGVIPHAPTGQTVNDYAPTGRTAPVHAPTGQTVNDYAPTGRTAPVHAPTGRTAPVHAPTGHFTVDQGNALGMSCPIPHAPTGHFTVAHGNAVGMQTNQTCALKGHLNKRGTDVWSVASVRHPTAKSTALEHRATTRASRPMHRQGGDPASAGPIFPIIGKTAKILSNHWKFFRSFFQSLENGTGAI